jgi:hypothetical protein
VSRAELKKSVDLKKKQLLVGPSWRAALGEHAVDKFYERGVAAEELAPNIWH